jgi:hypothetical protein
VTEADGPAGDSPEGPGYRPKPPLWRPPENRRRSATTIAISALALAFLGAVGTFPAVESHFLATPAEPTAVTVGWIENAEHADEETPMYFHYVVTLPDGSRGRLASEHLFKPGDRLVAMISRGRVTGRTIISPPYLPLQRD